MTNLKRLSASAVCALATIAICLAAAQPDSNPHNRQPQRPPGHPPVGNEQPAPGDEGDPLAEEPAENPEVDYTDARKVVKAMFDSLSGPAGEPRDWATYRSLFMKDAKMISSRPSPKAPRDVAHAFQLTIDDFVKMEDKYLTRSGYFETPVSIQLDEFGHMAHALCVYETRRKADDPEPYSRGVNSIQLIKDGPRWWIVTLVWDSESRDHMIPDAYLQDRYQTHDVAPDADQPPTNPHNPHGGGGG